MIKSFSSVQFFNLISRKVFLDLWTSSLGSRFSIFFFFFDIIGTKLVRERKENGFERDEQRGKFRFHWPYKLIELGFEKERTSIGDAFSSFN